MIKLLHHRLQILVYLANKVYRCALDYRRNIALDSIFFSFSDYEFIFHTVISKAVFLSSNLGDLLDR